MSRIDKKLFLTNLIVVVLCLCAGKILTPIGIPLSYPIVLFFILTALILTFTVSRIFFSPIRQMQKFTTQMAQGDFRSRLALSRKDELGDLADHLNRMSFEFRKKIQEITLDKNELKAILSCMDEGVIVIDKDEKIIILSAPVYDMLELRSQNPLGRLYWEVIRHEEVISLLKQAVEQKRPLKKEITVIAAQETHFSMQISCVLSDSGTLSAVVAVFHDITELKKLARLRSEFVANVSHELKTPLTTIKGFVETLKDGALNDRSQAKKFLEIIQRHTERLEYLVNDLLSLSSIESKEMKWNFEKWNVLQILESSVNLLKGRIEEGQYRLTLNAPKHLPSISLDRRKMEQVF